MTCHDIVATGRYPYTGRLGILSREDEKKVEEAMCAVHARELGSRDFNAISDGQRQRVLLARDLPEPEIIVLDEPTSFLDVKHKLELLAILRRMAKEKQITVIMSLHEIDLAEKIADKIICVRGRSPILLPGHRGDFSGRADPGTPVRSTMDFSIRALAALSCRVRKDCRRCLLSLRVAAESRFTAGCRRKIHRFAAGILSRMTLTISLRGCFRAR